MANLDPIPQHFAQPSWLRTPPHLWRPGALDRGALLEEAGRLQHTAGITALCRIFGGNLLGAYESSRELNRTIRKATRFALIVFIMYLHHYRGRGEPGVTYTRLREIFAMGSTSGVFATPTRIKAMLGLMQKAGQLRRAAAGADRRVRVLEPTEKLAEPMAIWLRAFLDAAAHAVPLARPVEGILAMPEFFAELFSYNALAYMHDRFVLYEAFPEIGFIMSRENGYITLREILRTLELVDGMWRAQAPYVELERRFYMARGTARNLVTEAERRGWLRAEKPGGQALVLEDAFVMRLQHWVALEMVWMAGLANAAAMRASDAGA